MKKLFFVLLIGTLTSLSYGQKDMTEYNLYVTKADSLYDAKDYKASAKAFQLAFDSNDGKGVPRDRYNAACSFALSGETEKAFYHLLYCSTHPKIKYKNYDHITTDSDLSSLHENVLWEKLILEVKANKDEYEKDFDKPLVAILDSIYQSDQGYRRQIGEIEEKYGRDSKEMMEHWKFINETDSINLIQIKEILDERGWLGPNVVGNRGNSTIFLVIQHADLETQINYLPMMREAVQLGNARASSLALLEDRVALRQDKRQIYGSQIGRDPETGEFYVSPLIEPEKVNDRRAEVGLSSIEDYIKHWDMTWDLEKHKERTEKIEAAEKD